MGLRRLSTTLLNRCREGEGRAAEPVASRCGPPVLWPAPPPLSLGAQLLNSVGSGCDSVDEQWSHGRVHLASCYKKVRISLEASKPRSLEAL